MSALYDYGVLKMQTEKYYFIPVSRCLKNLCVPVISTQATLHDWFALMRKQVKTQKYPGLKYPMPAHNQQKRRVSELHNTLLSSLTSWHIKLEFVID